jgi:hypothetical protein
MNMSDDDVPAPGKLKWSEPVQWELASGSTMSGHAIIVGNRVAVSWDVKHGHKSASSVLPRKDFDRPGNNKPFHNLPDCVMKQKTLADDWSDFTFVGKGVTHVALQQTLVVRDNHEDRPDVRYISLSPFLLS